MAGCDANVRGARDLPNLALKRKGRAPMIAHGPFFHSPTLRYFAPTQKGAASALVALAATGRFRCCGRPHHARAREDVRPSRVSREVLRALWSPTLHAQRAGSCWEMQPLPSSIQPQVTQPLSSSVRAQGPVAMANPKGQKALREA